MRFARDRRDETDKASGFHKQPPRTHCIAGAFGSRDCQSSNQPCIPGAGDQPNMSMYYSLILVPADPYSRPSPNRIYDFLRGIVDVGAIGNVEKIFVRHHKTASRTRERPEFTYTETIDALALAGRSNFDACIQGRGPSRIAPIRNLGSFDDHYRWRPWQELVASGALADDPFMNVECCQRSELVSTSDLHDETEAESFPELFGEPCELGDRVGLYSNPESMELINVPNAGCSTFWIAFGCGKWIFPRFVVNKIDFVHPKVMRIAENAFETKFTEGCCWG